MNLNARAFPQHQALPPRPDPRVPNRQVERMAADTGPQPEPEKRVATIQMRGRILADAEIGDGFTAAGISTQLDAIPIGSVDEIVLMIDSVGGDFASAQRIIDTLAARPETKIGHVVGVALSGAFLILMACDIRVASASAKMMMHAPHNSGCIAQTQAETKWCVDFVSRRCPSIPRATIEAWTIRNGSDGDGVWMTGPTAVALGIIHSRWVDTKPLPQIPLSQQPFQHDGSASTGECKCDKCRTARATDFADFLAQRNHRLARRARGDRRQPIALPPTPPTPRNGFIIGCAADLKQLRQPVAAAQNDIRALAQQDLMRDLPRAYQVLLNLSNAHFCIARNEARARAKS